MNVSFALLSAPLRPRADKADCGSDTEFTPVLALSPAPEDADASRPELEALRLAPTAEAAEELIQAMCEGEMRAPYSNVWVTRATARHKEIAILKDISDVTGMSGYDDCRAADLTIRALHGGIFDEARTIQVLENLGTQMLPFYQSWDIYLASCAVGRIADWQGRPEIMPAVGRTLGAIQRLAANPAFLEEHAPFWPLGDLRRVAELLLPLVPIEECRPLPE